MQLPINLESLLNHEAIESERIEFKKSWNPLTILHTLCAFANDFHNFGGGYLVIGVEEKNGRPLLPPIGLDLDKIDDMQKELLLLGNKIHPSYTPIAHPYKINEKYILLIWAPGGFDRPYKAPKSLVKGDKDFRYYIRKNTSTVQAGYAEEKELMELSGRIPFDDRINYEATLNDLEFALICDFLKKIKSDLYTEADKIPIEKLCRQMNIARGPDEMLRPVNVGLLFFNRNPQKFFPQAQIDVVEFPEGPEGNILREKIFIGSIDKTIEDALGYLKNQIIEEIIIKHPDRAQADRFFNVPYIALKESIVNAVYHRDYQIREPVEIRILPDEITIASHPGPDRSISLEALRAGKFISRRYRNRRIGDFLKELELTEGRGTGVPKIVKAMEANGSPSPIFESNEDRSYFVVRLPLHPKAIQKMTESRQSCDRVVAESIQDKIIELLSERPLSKSSLAEGLGQKTVTSRLNRAIRGLLDNQLIERTIPAKPNSRLQKYTLKEKEKDVGRKNLGGNL